MTYEELKRSVIDAVSGPDLERETVINACHRLSLRLSSGEYLPLLKQAGLDEKAAEEKMRQAAVFLDRDTLTYRVEREIGWLKERRTAPLGVIFHIGASNMEGLAAYSAVEGLLTGNVNLVKLPGEDEGINTFLLKELIELEPRLRPLIHVFRIPSSDRRRMRLLMDLSDGICVWGGLEAVKGVRQMAKANEKLIEWGHKLSFAYVTKRGMTEENLRGIAENIVSTGQMLCSSVQGIYLDSESIKEAEAFCRLFWKILEEEAGKYRPDETGSRAYYTLKAYEQELEDAASGKKNWRGNGISVSLDPDPSLKLAGGFGNCWVKLLPREKIIETLKWEKSLQQTVALACGQEEAKELSRLLIRAGAVRIKNVKELKKAECWEPHDGEYPLLRYLRILD